MTTETSNTKPAYNKAQTKAMTTFAQAAIEHGKTRGLLWKATSALARAFPDVIGGKAEAYRAAIKASLNDVPEESRSSAVQMASSVAAAMERGHEPPKEGEAVDAFRERSKKPGGRRTRGSNGTPAAANNPGAAERLAGEPVDVPADTAPFLKRIAKALSIGGLPLAQYLAAEAETWLKAQAVNKPADAPAPQREAA